MATKNDLIQILKELLLNRFAPKPNYVSGLLGNGVGAVVVPERPDYSYVRFNRSTTQVFEIFNKNVSPVHGWPVLIGELPWQPGLTQVIDTDWGAYEQVGWGDTGPEVSAHGESHEWNDGNPGSDVVNVYTRALVPLRTYSPFSGSTTVYAAPLEYEWNETGTFFPGTPGIDFAALINSIPTGTQLFAGVYLDPYTNTLGVVTGTQSVYSPAVLPAFPEFPGGVIPSARIRLRGYQVGIAEQNIYDARRLLRSDGSQVGPAGGDLTGTYPNPNVAGLYGYPLLNTVPAEGYILMFTGSAWRPIPGAGATGGGAWPADGKAKIDETEYSTLAAAYSAASAGDVIKLGPGTFTLTATLDIIKNITIIGTGKANTIIYYDSDHVIQVGDASNSPTVNLYNLTVEYGGTSASFYALYLDDGVLNCINVDVYGLNYNSGSTCRLYNQDDGTSIFIESSFFLANAGASTGDIALNYGSSGFGTVYGGVIDGEDKDIANTAASVMVYGAELVNNSYNKSSSASDFNGWYYFSGRAFNIFDGLLGIPSAPSVNDNFIINMTGMSDSNFVSTISGTPSGSTLVYGTVSSGNEDVLGAIDSNQLAKLVLHNTTRGNDALILSVNTGTNTITLTDTVPGTWASGDTITIASQTNTAAPGGIPFVDFEITSGLNSTSTVFVTLARIRDTGSTNKLVIFHPYETDSNPKRFPARTQTANIFLDFLMPKIQLVDNRFCCYWDAGGTSTFSLIASLVEEA